MREADVLQGRRPPGADRRPPGAGPRGPHSTSEVHLTGAALSTLRFAISPLSELLTSLAVLQGRHRHGGLHNPWVAAMRRDLGVAIVAELAAWAEPSTSAELLRTIPSPSGPGCTLDDQLHLLCQQRDLPRATPGPAATRPPRPSSDLVREASNETSPQELACRLERYWAAAVGPHWKRIHAILLADIDRRALACGRGGWASVLRDLHPDMTVSESHADLVIRAGRPAPALGAGTAEEALLVPSLFGSPNIRVAQAGPRGIQVIYGARGAAKAWERLGSRAPAAVDPLAALLGGTRARIVRALAVPGSTTRVAQQLDQSAASVSQHLRVLRESGLVTSRRSGREVIYEQTSAAESLVAAGDAATTWS